MGAEANQHHRRRMAEQGGLYDPRVARRIELGEAISAADYLDCIERRKAMIRQFAEGFAGFDAVLLPTTLNTPPALAELGEDADYLRFNAMSLRNTSVGNFLNGCAISLPMHNEGEAPCGLMAMAPWGMDAALFGVAAALEAALKAA